MEKNYEHVVKVKEPQRSDIIKIRMLIACGIISMILFICWFIDPEHIGYAPIFWLLTFALIFKLVKMLHEWYHYWSPSVPKMPSSTKQWKVDVLTTSCPGEPREMIIRTLRAMVAIKYPHTNYLCDEGNDPILKEICENLGVVHVTRVEKVNAKAGNINNALKQASGEIAVVLDPDHVPIPEFLDRVLPYFEDEKIGFVQCVQGYYNQEESFVARGAAEQTYHFYGPMMMCMNSYGTVQAIGANCTFRRTALDSIGGHAAGLSEDMHTAMQLHAKGWKSIYIPEMLTKGLVPGTLSSYYKQQLKWSRGTFDLLFHTFPKLYKNFTWRQKIHYFTIPLYFLFGLVNLVDIVVPLLALGMAEVPWELDLTKFGAYFVPLCVLNLCIRLYAQRWLLEEHEKGFHFAGGILRTATWWIFLIGFIYTIINVKVPYIPTPKEDEHQNYIKLSVPNIIVFVFCSLMVWYGLSIDWTPYSLAMAFYSLITVCMMVFTVIVSQQKMMLQFDRWVRAVPGCSFVKRLCNSAVVGTQQFVYSVLKQAAVVPILAFSSVFLGYNDIKKDYEKIDDLPIKECGGFYLATEIGKFKNEKDLFDIESFKGNWKNHEILRAQLQELSNRKHIPFVRFELLADSLKYLTNGLYDSSLKLCAKILREHRDPVFMTLSVNTDVDNEEYVKAWQYAYTFFNDLGISNITWIWWPNSINDMGSYPGEKFVDWIGIENTEKTTGTLSFFYDPWRNEFGRLKKPAMIKGFKVDDLEKLKMDYKEIHAVWLDQNDAGTLAWIKENNDSYFEDLISGRSHQTSEIAAKNYRSPFIKGKPGKFQLYVHNKPYYIRGVAYNTAHDWRDGNMPLTRRQIEKDLLSIKEMGANTIRRYGTGIYDRNILNIAGEFDMNVLFGFWFDPKIDFYADTNKVNEYIEDVLEKVNEYKDHHAIIAWSLGNESWGLLKHSFAKPYLTKVRSSYVQMIEYLAQRIHEIDPERPVFSCMEHEEYQLPGELVAFRDGAPSIDVMGVNSYYKQQISRLNHVAWQFDSLRPYLVSEFGPYGYWDPKYNLTKNRSIIEQTEQQKADWYREQWSNYVNAYKGFNIGGFAYCWHDRMEGSYTWFGLTDFKGRPKRSYYALKELWTKTTDLLLEPIYIDGPENFSPGAVCTFSATSNQPNLKYEWQLLKNDYLEKMNCIDAEDNAHVAKVTIPKEPANYRLYVFVTDENDRQVTTASVPIKVFQKNIP